MENNMSFKRGILNGFIIFSLSIIMMLFLFKYDVKAETMNYTSFQDAVTKLGLNLPSMLTDKTYHFIARVGNQYRVIGVSSYTISEFTSIEDMITGSNMVQYYGYASTWTTYYSGQINFPKDTVGTIIYAENDIVSTTGFKVYSKYIEPISIPLSYLQLGLKYSHPYYMLIQKNQTTKYFVASEKQFYVNVDGKIHKAADTAFAYTYDNVNWTVMNKMGDATQILGGITEDQVIYTNHGVKLTNVPSNNLSEQLVIQNSEDNVVINPKPIDDLDDDVIIYTYHHDTSVENVKNLNIKRKSLYQAGNLVIGASKTEYVVTWDNPESSGLKLEIAVQSKFNNKTRRITKQAYNKAWNSTGVYIQPEDKTMIVNIDSLGRWLLQNVWNNVDTGAWISIPPTEMYYRYVSLNSTTKKALYGNWSRMDFASGSQGIIEAVKDTSIITEETVNPSTGEIEYTDVIQDGNETEHINTGTGETVSEDDSFTGAVSQVDNALSHSTDTIKSVSSWLGQVPQLVGSLFTFVPQEAIAFIGLAFVLLMILKIAGR